MMSFIMRGFFGAYLLLRGEDKRGLGIFDISQRGVFLSFFAFFLVFPFYGFVFLRQDVSSLGLTPWYLLFLLFFIDGIAWLVYPLAMRNVVVALDRGSRFMVFVVARNWSRALWVLLFYSAFLLAPLTGGVVLADGVVQLSPFLVLFWLFLFLFLLRYRWFVAKTSLDVSGGRAAVVVFLEILIDACSGLFFQSYVSYVTGA